MFFCSDTDGFLQLPGDPPVQLSAQAFVNGRTHRCTLEAALRVDSRLQGRFLDSSTTSVNCNGRERRLLVYTCTGTGCKYRIQLESSLSPEEWCCTVLRPFHTCVPTAGEISPDLQKSMDYFVSFLVPLNSVVLTKLTRSRPSGSTFRCLRRQPRLPYALPTLESPAR